MARQLIWVTPVLLVALGQWRSIKRETPSTKLLYFGTMGLAALLLGFVEQAARFPSVAAVVEALLNPWTPVP